MVVLAAAVATKTGKALVARQFVDVARSRIEALIAAFPRLVASGQQHTFVDTDAVRFVYQPIDDLYVVLITNKHSNILQDISTLALVARTVSEYCRHATEKEILKHAFDLIVAFDEVISLGYRENVNVSQIRTFTEMESHEEKLQEMLQKSKEREAIENAKLKAKQLEMQRREARKQSSGGGGSLSSSSFGSSMRQPMLQSEPKTSYTSPPASSSGQVSSFAPPASQKRGMQLGGKPKTSDVLDAIRQDEGIVDVPEELPTSVTIPSPGNAAPNLARISQGPVHVQIEEKLNAILNRDGGLDNLEVKGELILRISDPAKARLRFLVNASQSSDLQFKTHPHVDRNLWSSQSIIGCKDAAKPFPVNQSTPVVKWRYSTKDESMVPLTINFWPSPTGDGTVDCSVEYELLAENQELKDVVVSIPLPPGTGAPKVENVDGDYRLGSGQRTLEWHIPVVDKDSSSGTFEFSIKGDSADALFPVKVSFIAQKSFCNVDVQSMLSAEDGTEIAFTKELFLVTDDFQIV